MDGKKEEREQENAGNVIIDRGIAWPFILGSEIAGEDKTDACGEGDCFDVNEWNGHSHTANTSLYCE